MTPLDLPLATFHDYALLRAHMQLCERVRSPMHRLQCVAESVDAFLAPRFVTTLAATLVLLVGAALIA